MSIVNDLVHFILVSRLSLSKAHNLDFVLTIFLDGQLFLIVEQIDTFAAIQFEETHVELHTGRCQLVHVFDGFLGHGRNCEGLS